jgi:N-acetylglucosaminyldiphosphoundecaprenol N-acetyl-beta-D-mannosaminyltransferase
MTGADMALPDGAPVAWSMRAKGARGQERLDGPGTMWRLCEQAEASGVRIGLYGSTPAVLDALTFRLKQHFPRLKVAYAWSPPFRALTSAEQWMSDHRGHIPAVMLGVGAAFDFHADVAARAPQWMRDAGLEWLYRLIGDPRRLARRYLVTNTVFIASSGVEAVKSGVAAVKSGVSAARRFVGPGKSRIPVGSDVGDQQKTIADDQL